MRSAPARALTLVALGALVAGCAAGPTDDSAPQHPDRATPASEQTASEQTANEQTATAAARPGDRQTSPAAADTPSTETSSADTSSAGSRVATPWRPGAGEVRPQIKRTATRIVELAGAWPRGGGSAAAIERRLESHDVAPRAARALGVALAHPDARSVEVRYPQYGGLTASRSSVMLVLDQHLRSDSSPAGRSVRELTLDVRLAKGPHGWRVTAVYGPATGAAVGPAASPLTGETGAGSPAPAPDAENLAATALEHPNLRLPRDARADIRAGRVQPELLRVMLAVAQKHRIDVTVLLSAHPREVFGTPRASKHSTGRAVDVWRIDGHRVVDPATPRALITDVMRTAAAAGANGGIGAPFLPPDPSAKAFTDDLHADHLHLAVAAR